MKKCSMPHWLAVVVLALIVAPLSAAAQDRTLEDLKAEVLKRAETKRGPLERVKMEDVQLVVSRLTAVDPEIWAKEWMRVAENYEKKGNELLKSGKKKEAQESLYQAY